MLRVSTSLAALLLIAAPALARDAAPHDEVKKQCEEQARKEAGSPPVSPREQPSAAVRSERPSPRRPAPDATRQDAQAEKTPVTPGNDPRETYRIAYEACLRARGQ